MNYLQVSITSIKIKRSICYSCAICSLCLRISIIVIPEHNLSLQQLKVVIYNDVAYVEVENLFS